MNKPLNSEFRVPQSRRMSPKAKRKRVLDNAENFLDKVFSSMVFSDSVLNLGDWELKKSSVIEHFKTEIKEPFYYLQAHNYFIERILAFCQQHQCKLSLPPQLFQNRRYPSTRTHKFHTNAEKLNYLSDAFIELIEHENLGKALRITNQASDIESTKHLIIFSASLYGGLLEPNALLALYESISKPQFLYSNIEGEIENEHLDRPYVELKYPNSNLHNIRELGQSDQYEIDGENSAGYRLKRWYLDDISKALMVRLAKFSRQLRLKSQKPHSSQSLYKAMNRTVSNLICFDHEVNVQWPSGVKAYCKAAMTVIESLPNSQATVALLESAIENSPSACLPTKMHDVLQRRDFKVPKNSLNYHDFTQMPELQTSKSNKTVTDVDFYAAQIRHLLKNTDSNGTKNSFLKVDQALAEHNDEDWPKFPRLLKHWLRYMMSDACKGVKAVSTLKTYSSRVSKELLVLAFDQSLSDFESEDFFEAYSEIIDRCKTDSSKNITTVSLSNFHRFCASRQVFPDLKESLGKGQTLTAFVNAGYVSYEHFSKTLAYLDNIENMSTEMQSGIQVLFMLAYRSGLRLAELLKLTMRDIEPSKDRWLFVHTNKYGTLKKPSSRRKIKLAALMLPEESQLLENWLITRKSHHARANDLLFHCLGEPMQLWPSSSISQLIASALRKVSNHDGFVFHHLRHTAVNNAFFCLEHENSQTFICEYTGWQSSQIKTIEEYVGGQSWQKRDYYWGLAAFAGHATPATTFKSYLHFTDVILNEQTNVLPGLKKRKWFKQLSGISEQKLKKSPKYRDLLWKSECDNIQKAIEQTKWSSEKDLQNHVLSLKPKYTIQFCYFMMQELNAGATLAYLSNTYHVEKEYLQKWQTNCLAIAQFKTKYNRSRNIKNLNEIAPLPASIRSNREQIDANNLIEKIRPILRDKEKRESFKKALKYYLLRSYRTKHGIPFTGIKRLLSLIMLLKPAIPLRRWRIEVSHYNADQKSDIIEKTSKIKQKGERGMVVEWSNSLDHLSNNKSFTAPNSKIRFHLKLRHINEKKLIEKSKKNNKRIKKSMSAKSLRYMVHMMAVMMLNDDFN